jgi:hypothetical protein
LSVRHDAILTALFNAVAAGVPLASIPDAASAPVREPIGRSVPSAMPTASPSVLSARDEDVRSISGYPGTQ